MTESYEESPARDRALKAAAITLALLLVAPGADALINVAGKPTEMSTISGGFSAPALVQADNPFVTLDRIEELLSVDGAEVSEAFSREVGFLTGARDVRVDATGKVVGYVVDRDASDALDDLSRRMNLLGWRGVSLGEVEGATFVKSEGTCTWALVTCTQVGSSTSVVVRCMYR